MAALFCGGGLTVALGAIGIGILIGPIVMIVGLFAVPMGLYRFLLPLTGNVFQALGADGPARQAAVTAIEGELALPSAEHLTFGDYVLSVTDRWIVLRDASELVIARRDALLWAYKSVTTHKKYGIKTGETVRLALHVFGNSPFTVHVDEAQIPHILERLGRASPRAFIGYRPDLDGIAQERLRDLCLGHAPRNANAAAIGVESTVSPAPPDPYQPSPHAPSSGSWVGKFFLAIGGLGAVTIIGGSLVTFLCCGGMAGIGMYAQSQVAPLAQACSGTPVVGAAARGASTKARVAKRSGGSWKIESGGLTPAIQGSTVAGTAWVLCLEEPAEVEEETCRDGRVRTRWNTRARLVEAATGTVVSDETVAGDPAPACSTGGKRPSGDGPKPDSKFWSRYLPERLAG